MGLEVRQAGPIETPRHRDTIYLPATTVPPTVVALRPKRAETVARAQFLQMGIDLGRHQPMHIIPSIHVEFREAFITDEVEKPSHAQRAAPAAWRPVRSSPAAPSLARQRPLGRANPASCGAHVPGGAGLVRSPDRPSRSARPPPRPGPRVAAPSATTAPGVATFRRVPRPPAFPTSPRWPSGALGAP